MMLSNRMSRFVGGLGALLLPWTCVVCGGAGGGSDLCDDCAVRLPVLGCACPRCAQPLQTTAALCGRCLKRLPRFDAAFAALRYRAEVPALVQRFKLGGKLAVGRVLAEQLAAAVARRAAPLPQLLLPVPLHPLRLRHRGFDQAHEISRVLARQLALPVAWHGLKRVRDTATQTGLKRRERRGNVFRAFAAGQPLPSAVQHVALIDDVMTTGATADACARVLKRLGVARVEVWALARAGRAR